MAKTNIGTAAEPNMVCTKADLKAHLISIGEEKVDDTVINEMISIADENGDGMVTKLEFCRAAMEEKPTKGR